MVANDNLNPNQSPFDANNGYAYTTNILITIALVLFFLILLIISLHFYARYYLSRARRRHLLRRQYLIFHFPSDLPPTGLDPSVLQSLPTFVYSSEANPIIECAVCLSHFEEKELGRALPKCNHKFHVACIDMWFMSHSTCPLCRSLVEFQPGLEGGWSETEVVVDTGEPGSGGEGVDLTGCTVCSSRSSVSVVVDEPMSWSLGREKEGH